MQSVRAPSLSETDGSGASAASVTAAHATVISAGTEELQHGEPEFSAKEWPAWRARSTTSGSGHFLLRAHQAIKMASARAFSLVEVQSIAAAEEYASFATNTSFLRSSSLRLVSSGDRGMGGSSSSGRPPCTWTSCLLLGSCSREAASQRESFLEISKPGGKSGSRSLEFLPLE